jgi:hypothetical protein
MKKGNLTWRGVFPANRQLTTFFFPPTSPLFMAGPLQAGRFTSPWALIAFVF